MKAHAALQLFSLAIQLFPKIIWSLPTDLVERTEDGSSGDVNAITSGTDDDTFDLDDDLTEEGAMINSTGRRLSDSQNRNSYHIRSSNATSPVLVSARNAIMYSVPINITLYENLLRGAMDDVALREFKDQTEHYEFTYGGWEFDVTAVNGEKLSNMNVYKIAHRFFNLIPPENGKMTYTRAGVVDKVPAPTTETPNPAGIPVADIWIHPVTTGFSTDLSSFELAAELAENGEPTVDSNFPNGTITERVIHQHTLEYFVAYAHSMSGFRTRQVTTTNISEIINAKYPLAIENSDLSLSIQVWRQQGQHLRQGLVICLKEAVALAINDLSLSVDLATAAGATAAFTTDKISSGAYTWGESVASFAMWTVAPENSNQPVLLQATEWQNLTARLISPFQDLDGAAAFLAVEGEIMKNNARVGYWHLLSADSVGVTASGL